MRARLSGLGAAGLILVIDQWAKYWVQTHARQLPVTWTLAGCEASISFARNGGAFLSLGATMPDFARMIVFMLFPAVVVVGAATYYLVGRGGTPVQRLCVLVVAAGATGNLIDRVRNDNLVTDFMFLGCGPFHTGIFNFADMALISAVVILALTEIRDFADWRHDLTDV